MFTIGDFATIGQVSVRMLRHYDEIGLLRPARVDASSGYRSYGADQLPRLNRILALKDLGFRLQEISSLLDEDVSVEELHGMLRMRRTELAAEVEQGQARLARVEARIRAIESEDQMEAHDVVLKTIPPTRVAELTATSPSWDGEDIGPTIRPLYPELARRMAKAGLRATGPAVSFYEDAPGDGDAILVHASIPVDVVETDGLDVTVLDLPQIDAATYVHHGPMDSLGPSYEALLRWIDANGYRAIGYSREVSLECELDAQHTWVTELQFHIEPAG